jgi:hypothetical protein
MGLAGSSAALSHLAVPHARMHATIKTSLSQKLAGYWFFN